jgi:VCBS repeat protein
MIYIFKNNMNDLKILFFIIFLFLHNHLLNAQMLSFNEVAAPLGIHYGDSPSGSLCWGDYDNDNDIDLYVVNRGYAITGPQNFNFLFRNDVNIDGKFYEVATQLGVDEEFPASSGAAWCDVNNDGLLDLYVSNSSDYIVPYENKLFINNGTIFEDQTGNYNVSNFGNNFSCCWGDYDSDGDQDLFVVTGEYDTVKSRLFRNDDIIFTDVSDIYNINIGTFNLSVANWVDYDNDGDLDLYLYISVFENRLYENRINENNTFVNVAPVYNLNDTGSSGGSLWFDYDTDGDFDLFLVNFRYQGSPLYQRPSKLFRNDLNMNNQFTDVTLGIGFPDSLSAYSGTVGDYDLDGDIDIYLTDQHRENKYFRNDVNNSGLFIEEGVSLNVADTLEGKAASSADYDNDGDLDIFVLNHGGAEYNRMYRNNFDSNRYLIIRLTDKNGSFNRFGSKVKVYYAGTESLVGMRVVDGGGSGGEIQNQYDCHFGLTPNYAYDIEVIFTTKTNGQNHIFNKLNRPELGNYIPAHQGHFLEVRDSAVTVTSVNSYNSPKIINNFKLYQNYPNPFNSTTTIPFQLDKSYTVKLVIYDLNGKEIMVFEKGHLSKGYYSNNWDAKNNSRKDTASGVYVCSLYLDNNLRDMRKIILLR